MKKKTFGLLVLMCAANGLLCSDDVINKPNVLSQYDYDCLEELYKYDSKGLLSQEITEFFINEYLDVLARHITILEQEIIEKKSWFKRSDVKAFFAELKEDTGYKIFFLIYAGMIGFYGGLLMRPVCEEYKQIKLDKFKETNIPAWMLKKLRFIRFTRAEKRRLDQRDVNKIYYASASNLNRKPYTAREQEKIKYLGRKLAPLEAILRMCAHGVLPAFCIALVGGMLYTITPSAKRGMMKSLPDCLERDKRIFELLTSEKELFA